MGHDRTRSNRVDLSLILRALEFSAERHRDQRRKGESARPYINHPIEVASLIANVGGVDAPEVLAAALLHDTIEDTGTSALDLESRFGRDVRALVQEVTDDKSLPKAERKRIQIERAPGLSPRAKLIKVADKISNVREVTDDPPVDWSLERRLDYLNWAERVVLGCRGCNPALEACFDELLERARATVRER